MPNPSRYGGTLEATVRAHFGLTQAELARYLGVSARHVGNVEAELRAAVKRRGDLGAALNSRGPVLAFRIAVDLRQVTQSLAVLNEARQEVVDHRATLPAQAARGHLTP